MAVEPGRRPGEREQEGAAVALVIAVAVCVKVLADVAEDGGEVIFGGRVAVRSRGCHIGVSSEVA